MTTKTLLKISCSIELATGIAVIASPALVASVLFAAALTPAGVAIGRVGGCGLFALAIGCWPRSASWLQDEGALTQPIRALFLYNLLAACYLGYLEISGTFATPFLILAAVLHGVLTLLFLRPAYRTVAAKAGRTLPNP